MIVSVTLNPSVDLALFVDELKLSDTNRVRRVEKDAGGKGVNLSRVVAELGGPTLATGFLGGGAGAYVRSVLDRQRCRHDFVEVEGETRINFSVEDQSKRPPTTFNDRGPTITAENLDILTARLRGHLVGASWLALGGSLPHGLDTDVYASLVRLGHELGVKVCLDADGEPMQLGLAERPDFVKPNAAEAARLLGRSIGTAEEAIVAVREIRERLSPNGIAVLSMGAIGAACADPEATYWSDGVEVEVRSTIGSGDSLIAGFLWALESGRSTAEALAWGVSCGAATAATDGSEIGRRPVVESLFPKVTVTGT